MTNLFNRYAAPSLKCISPVLICVMLLTAGCADTESSGDYPNSHLLLSAEAVSNQLDTPSVRIIDMREEGFQEGHIPGAVHISGAGELHREDYEIANFLIDGETFSGLMSRKGISEDDTVIIYDEGNGLQAARMYYALEVYGHENKHLLNGGFSAWQASDYEISQSSGQPDPSDYQIRQDQSGEVMCNLNDIIAAIDDDDTIVFDVRSEEEYTGQQKRADYAGHIPGAVHLEWNNFILTGEDIPYFKSSSEIESLLAEHGITPDKEILPHCQSNVRGSHVFFTLRLMGYDNLRAYEGSWAEYGNTEGVPVEQ